MCTDIFLDCFVVGPGHHCQPDPFGATENEGIERSNPIKGRLKITFKTGSQICEKGTYAPRPYSITLTSEAILEIRVGGLGRFSLSPGRTVEGVDSERRLDTPRVYALLSKAPT